MSGVQTSDQAGSTSALLREMPEQPLWSAPPPSRVALEVALVVAGVLLATWARLALDPWLGSRVAFITFFPLLVTLSRWCSLWPLLLGCALSAFMALWWVVEPHGVLVLSRVEMVQVVLFLAAAVYLVVIARAGNLARARALSRGRDLEAALARVREREEALAGSEAKFRALVDGATHLIWSSTPEGTVTFLNQTWYTYTGTAVEDARDRAEWGGVIHPDDVEGLAAAVAAARREGAPWQHEYRIRSRDGVWRWFHGRGWPMRAGDGGVVAWQGMAVDIHQQREAIEALRRSEEFNRRIIESSGDSFTLLDRDGHLIPAAESALTGDGHANPANPAQAREGQEFAGLWQGGARAAAAAAVNQAANGARGRFQGMVAPGDAATTPTAPDAPPPRWWDVTVSAILDRHGRPERLLASAHDITDSRTTLARLQETEARFRDLAETMPQLVWIAGSDGKLRWTNRHWQDYVGEAFEISRAAGWPAFHHDDSAMMFAEWRKAQDEKRPYEIEVRIRHAADGAFHWFLVRAIPRFAADGAIEGWIGTCTDIQGLKAAEQALREAGERDRRREHQLRLALDAGDIGTWDMPASGAGIAVDLRAQTIFGLPPQAMRMSGSGSHPAIKPGDHPGDGHGRRSGSDTGRAHADFAVFLAAIHPDDRAGVEAHLRRVLTEKSGGRYEAEFRVLGRDGAVRYLKVFGRAAGSDGGLNGTVIDLSALKRSDARDRLQAEAGAMLMESFDLPSVLRAVADLCTARIADWCTIDLVDDRGDLGAEPTRVAIAHRDPRKLALAAEFRKRYPPQAGSPSRRVLASGKPFLLEHITDDMIVKSAQDDEHLRMIRELGLRSLVVVPLKARDRVLGTLSLVTAESRRSLGPADLAFTAELGRRIGLTIDNARLFAAERHARTFAVERAEALSRVNAELEQFAFVCSHDLQEPLRMILQYIDLLRMRLGATLDEKNGRYFDLVSESAERMRALILDLLAYARIGHAEPPVAHAVDLERVLTEVRDILRPALLESAAEIVVASPLPMVLGDKLQMVQVFQNLLANALKFRGNKPPKVIIAAAEATADAPGRVTVSISDNGIGIPAEQRERVFEVFQRLHPRESYPGSGIGLAICRKIVTRMDGKIWIEEAVGGGAKFVMTLPAALADSARTPDPQTSAEPQTPA